MLNKPNARKIEFNLPRRRSALAIEFDYRPVSASDHSVRSVIRQRTERSEMRIGDGNVWSDTRL